MPNKMTDNEIKKFLEYLKNDEDIGEDSLVYKYFCQKAEIERLTIECESQSILWSKHFESIFESAKETIKAEAYKEFAKKVYDKRHRTVEGECVICEDDFFKAFEELGGKVSDVIDYY